MKHSHLNKTLISIGRYAYALLTFDASLFPGKNNRCQRVLEKQGKGGGNVVVIDRLRVTTPVEHFLIEELSKGKYRAAHLLGGGGGGSSDTPPELRDIPNVLKASLKERLEEGNAPKQDAKADCQRKLFKFQGQYCYFLYI